MSCTVTLTIRAESTAWGETLGVAGSIPQLSTWGATTPPSLVASPFPLWTTTLTLPAETLVQYKYVILSSSKILRWEVLPSSTENRSFTTPPDGHTLAIDDGTIGDNNRTSATVTPATTPTVTPRTTPTRSQKPLDQTTDQPVQQQQQQKQEQEQEQGKQLQQHDQRSLAEFTAELDNSRRQIEHVRAAVRRIRRIPTPDALPTPPSTPTYSNNLSPDAAAALVNHTLNEAKENIDIICEKLRAVRTAKAQPVTPRLNPVFLFGVIGFIVAILIIGIIVFYPHVDRRLPRVVAVGSEAFDTAVMVWGNIMSFGESAWKAVKCWSVDIRYNLLTRLPQGARNGAVHAVERAKMMFVPNVQDWLAALFRASKDVGDRVGGQVRKLVTRVPDFRTA